MKIAATTDTHLGASQNTIKIHEKFIKRLAAEEFDVLVHTGDIASHKQKQLHRSLSMFREALGDIPILFVLGNHDLWDMEAWNQKNKRYNKRTSYESMRATQREWFDELNVHYLQDKEYYYKDEAIFYGYDGWYKNLPSGSNDKHWMPPVAKQCPIDTYLVYRSNKTLDSILMAAEGVKRDKPNIKLVCATHHSLTKYRGGSANDNMNGDPRHLDFLSENFDLVLNGHSHQEVDQIHAFTHGNSVHSCRIVNVGSDYDKPKYRILEI